MRPEPKIDRARRRFIVGASLGAVAAAGGAGLYAVRERQRPDYGDDAYRAWRQLRQGGLSDRQYMVLCATLAPSPHNTQPWKFRIGDDGIEVMADLERALGSADPELRQLYQGLGCAVENLEVAARYLGYDSVVEMRDVAGERPPSVLVRLEARDRDAATAAAEAAFLALFDRQTNRSAYDMSIEVPGALLERLGAVAEPGTRLDLHRAGEIDTAYLGSFLRQSVRERVRDDDYYHDSIEWWRYSRDELLARRDGISIHTADAPFFVKEGMERFVDEALWKGDFGRQGEVDALDALIDATPVWGVIWGDAGTVRARVDGGRALERVYLLATRSGLFVHPVNYVVESPRLAERFTRWAGAPEGAELLTIFRLGGGRAMERSPRRPWREMLV